MTARSNNGISLFDRILFQTLVHLFQRITRSTPADLKFQNIMENSEQPKDVILQRNLGLWTTICIAY